MRTSQIYSSFDVDGNIEYFNPSEFLSRFSSLALIITT